MVDAFKYITSKVDILVLILVIIQSKTQSEVTMYTIQIKNT